ncbi:hypothetical protein ACT8ZV_11835 [Nocardioides sp. MAHUQ-72]|uniref:hypothetical protein n=1 Tax=unclassified Nocardioides TaxID=2615069 RepID=UPI00360AD191
MREIMHVLAAALVLVVASACVLVQLAQVDQAYERVHQRAVLTSYVDHSPSVHRHGERR